MVHKLNEVLHIEGDMREVSLKLGILPVAVILMPILVGLLFLLCLDLSLTP